MDVADTISNPIACLRRQVFAESTLRALIETMVPYEHKRRLLREIRACAQQHLSEILEPSWSARGLWRWFLRQIAARRMDSIFDRLKIELETGSGANRIRDRYIYPASSPT
jgi:hypothetical protein